MNEKLYISPLDFSGSDAAAIQAAVDEATRLDIRMVVIPARADGAPWQVDKTILIPSSTTIVLDGSIIEAGCTIFANSNAYKADTKSLGGEEHDLFLIGKKGATLTATADAPQIYLSNVRDFRIAGITFAGGQGLKLNYARIAKVQQLKFEGSEHGIAMDEGCSGLLISDIAGVTGQETILMQGGAGRLYGRDPDIRKSIICRIQARTNGAPAVGLYAGRTPMSYLTIRDITDLTEGEGVSVRLGETDQEIRDITIRGVDTKRAAVETTAECDGLYCANLGGSYIPKTTNYRTAVDRAKMDIALPQFPEDEADANFLTPNAAEFWGDTDAQTIQNAIDAAASQGINRVVIPRWNVRTQSTVWSIEKAIALPSGMTVELWGTHLRQADFCYENLFAAKDADNITLTGVGDAVLDGGLHNRLHEKNAGKYGLGPIENNAMLRFDNVTNLKLEHFRIKQSRWYAMYLRYCSHADIGNIDFSTYALFADLGGIYVRSGCHDFLIHDLTGVVSDDMISLTAQGCDGVEAGKDMSIRDITICNIKADPRRWGLVRLRNHDGRRISNVLIDTVLDVSLAEQKMTPASSVFVGATDGYYERRAEPGELSHITVRDLCSRAMGAVTFSGFSENIILDNIHSFSGATNAVCVLDKAEVHDVHMTSIFFRCDQASGYMRGTATSIITDKKKYRGIALALTNLMGGNITVDNVLAERVGGGVRLTGGASVTVTNMDVAEYGKFLASCDANSSLCVNGVEVAPPDPKPS